VKTLKMLAELTETAVEW